MKTSPGKLMAALKAGIEALVFPPTVDGVACPFAGQAVFEQVKVFDFDDIALAFEEMLAFKKRVAFIVVNNETQASNISGFTLTVSFHEDFTILASDRSYKNRQIAQVGDSTTPGVLLIEHVMVDGLAGEFAEGIVCEPQGGELFAITGEERDEQIGRIGWRQNFRLHGGRVVRQLSRKALETLVR